MDFIFKHADIGFTDGVSDDLMFAFVEETCWCCIGNYSFMQPNFPSHSQVPNYPNYSNWPHSSNCPKCPDCPNYPY